jgi:hypothetical protein
MRRRHTNNGSGRRPRARSLAAAWCLALLVLSGCRSEMYEQPRYEPLEPSTFFDNGASARPLVAGTVPREDPRGAPPAGAPEDVFYSTARSWSADSSATGSTASPATANRATAAA